MAAMTFRFKSGDLLPALEVNLLDGLGNVVDLSDIGSVHFHMGGPGGEVINKPATVVDAPTGSVRYDWQGPDGDQPGDTDQPGVFNAEFEVVSGGKPTTFPNDRDIIIVIRKAVA